MAEWEGKAQTSPTHTMEVTTANTRKPENDLKTAEQPIHPWGRKEDHTEKCIKWQSHSQMVAKPFPLTAHRHEEWSGEGGGTRTLNT